MKKIAFFLSVLATVAMASQALADSRTVQVGGRTIDITTSRTVTTSTTQGNVNLSPNTYVYGQSQTFQPSSTGGNTNSHTVDQTTYTLGIGRRF